MYILCQFVLNDQPKHKPLRLTLLVTNLIHQSVDQQPLSLSTSLLESVLTFMMSLDFPGKLIPTRGETHKFIPLQRSLHESLRHVKIVDSQTLFIGDNSIILTGPEADVGEIASLKSTPASLATSGGFFVFTQYCILDGPLCKCGANLRRRPYDVQVH